MQKSVRELEKEIQELKKENDELRNQASFRKPIDSLSLSEKTIQSILDEMGDTVFIKDDQSRLLIVNNAFCKTFNLPRSKIIGRTLIEEVTEEESIHFLKNDKQVLQTGIESTVEETLTIDNKTIYLSSRKSRFIDSNGNKYLLGVSRDITSQKKAEVELLESEAQLKALNATRDQLLSIIAHDLRSPFSSIVGLTDFLNENLDSLTNPSIRNYVQIIHSTAKNNLTLLDSLLDWANSQTGHLVIHQEEINLASIIDEIKQSLLPEAATKLINISVSTTTNLVLKTDSRILKTILRNLLSNSIKFTKNYGEIHISTIPKKKHVEIYIQDSGVGIKKEVLDQLFKKQASDSNSNDSKTTNSGLGLILCKEFVEKLGGIIQVESELGKGSTFMFTLPIVK